MTVKIAHISDVHWESRDDNVSDLLLQAVPLQRPDFLVFTGDLVNNPWNIAKAKPWLLHLCDKCNLNPHERLLLVRGNHDVLAFGNFGFRPITGHVFRLHFDHWMRSKVFVFPEHQLVFLCIESNPLLFSFARGKVGSWELGKVRREWRSKLESNPDLKNFTKVVLLHHHPLPMAFEGGDFFLLLKDAQRLIQFLAEQNFHLVLHGHKHRAPYSLLNLGTCGGSDRVIEVLGAGSTIKGGADHDPRGHNFNLLTIENSGLRFIRQFFAAPGEGFAELPGLGFPHHTFEHAYRRAFVSGHKYQSIRWVMDIDIEGDRFNQLSYSGLSTVDPSVQLLYIDPPPYKLDTGHLSPVRLNLDKTSPDVVLKPFVTQERRCQKIRLRFPKSPTPREPLDFTLESYDLNASSMNRSEFERKFPHRPISREWDQKLIRVPVENFSWTIRFPDQLVFDSTRLPKFEVVDDATDIAHEWLTRVLQPCFHYSAALHTATLSIYKPPVGYLYRIYWYIPEQKALAAISDPTQIVTVQRFSEALLKHAASRQPNAALPQNLQAVNQRLLAFRDKVQHYIETQYNAAGLVDPAKLDVSFMVYDPGSGDAPPLLRIVGTTVPNDERFWTFTVEVGDGNAGRAYKTNAVRCYDPRDDDPKEQTYIFIPNQRQHECLYSLPLKNPHAMDLLFGVLNFGTFSAQQGLLLRHLNNDESMVWLLQLAHHELLPQLQEIAKLVK